MSFMAHTIVRCLIEKSRLSFVTPKGISNGEAPEGKPGEKEGGVGQGGPKIPSMDASTPRIAAVVTTGHLATRHKRFFTINPFFTEGVSHSMIIDFS
jgi:hypothetical protein